MRQIFAAAALVMIVSIAVSAQEPQRAPEGRGLLPRPTEMPATLGGAPSLHPFARDLSGGFSRTIFETDEDPNFKLIIRDFSFPPNRQSHTITLPSGAFVQLLSGLGEISVANQRLTLTTGARTAVPAGVPIAIVNDGQQPSVVRALIVEGK
jgi:quercetin dioxygenase-like cupin family protein